KVTPEAIDRFRETLKQVSSRTGPLELADVQKLRDALAKTGAAEPVEVDAANQLSAILQDATGKPPGRSLTYLSKLQEVARKDGAESSKLGMADLSNLQDAMRRCTSEQPAIQMGDLNNFAKLIQDRTGPDGKVNVGDAHEVLEVL